MSIYKHHHLDGQRQRRAPPSLQPPSPNRRLDRAPPSAPLSSSFRTASSALDSTSGVLSRANVRLTELHGNALEERTRGRQCATTKDGGLKAPAKSAGATIAVGGMNATGYMFDATAVGSRTEPSSTPAVRHGSGNQSEGWKRKRGRKPSPVVSGSSLSSLTSLSGLSSLSSEDEGEELAEPVWKRVKVGHEDNEEEEEEEEEGRDEDGDDGDGEGERAATSVVGRLLDRVEGESEGEDEDEDRGEDEEDSEEDVREENDDENGIEEEDSEDDNNTSEDDDDDSFSSDADSDYASSSSRAAPRRMRVPSPKGAYRMPMSMRLQQRMVVALSGEGGEKDEDAVERRRKAVGLKTPKGRVEPASRGRSGTTSCPTTPRTPNAPSPSSRGGIPTSTRLQERRFKALVEQEGTPSKRVRWEWDADIGVGKGLRGKGKRDEGQKTPLSTRLQARMLREREEGYASLASPSGRRVASDSGGMHPAVPSVCRESSPKGLPPPIPVAIIDASEVQEDTNEESESEPGSAAESGGRDGEDEDDDAESEVADADCAAGTTVDVGRAWLSGAKATTVTGKALREIMGYGSDVSEEEGEGGDDEHVDLEGAEANTSPSRNHLLIAPDVDGRDEDGVTVAPTERQEPQLLATTVSPWDDVPGPLGVPVGLVSAADAQEGAQEIDNLVAHIPECNNPVQNRRSSARLAGIHSRRGYLPPPLVSSTARRKARGSASGEKTPKSDTPVPISASTNQTGSTTTPSSTPKPRPNFRVVEEPEEVKRARLAYPDPLKSSKCRREEAGKGDWNARNSVDWETSLGKRVAVRMREMGVGV